MLVDWQVKNNPHQLLLMGALNLDKF